MIYSDNILQPTVILNLEPLLPVVYIHLSVAGGSSEAAWPGQPWPGDDGQDDRPAHQRQGRPA